ncbi:MAG: Glycerophosphoryl diester phosphodiesterase, partial [uncultured Blastococcus sp.]
GCRARRPLRLPRRAHAAGDGAPRRRGGAPREHDAGLPGVRGPRLPVPGDRCPGHGRRRPRRLPRPDPGAGDRPRRAGTAPPLGRGLAGQDRRTGADPAPGGPARRLARRPVQPRHQGRRRAGAAGPCGRAPGRRRPHLPGIVLRRPHRRRPAAVRPVGVHVARAARGRRAPAVLLLPPGGGTGPRPGRLRAGAAAAGRAGPGRRAIHRRGPRPRAPGARVDRRHRGGGLADARPRGRRRHDRPAGHVARAAGEARPVVPAV